MNRLAQHGLAGGFAGKKGRAWPISARRAGRGLDDFQGGISRWDAVYTFLAAQPKGGRTQDTKAIGRGLKARALALG